MWYIALWLVTLLAPMSLVRGEALPLAPSLSCFPDTATVRPDKQLGLVFMLTSGETPSFKCALDNPSDHPLPFMVIGQMMPTDGNDGLAVSTTEGRLEAHGTGSQPLVFPAVYRAGAYRFTFKATNTESKAELTTSMAITGLVDGRQSAAMPKIVSVVPQESDTAWGGQVSLAVTLVAPVQVEKTILRMILQDQAGADCAVLDEKTNVKNGTETYTLTLPKDKADVCSSTLAVELRDEAGGITDRKVVALGLPTREAVAAVHGGALGEWWASVSLFTKIGVAGVVLLGGALLGLWLMRRLG